MTKSHRARRSALFGSSCWLFVVFPAMCRAESGVAVVQVPGTGQYRILDGDQPVLQYNYQAVAVPAGYLEKVNVGSRKYACERSDYIHPLYGPNGEELTEDWSVDHPHHRGIYWAWPEVQYKGETGDLHALQRVFARPTGKIELRQGKDFAEIVAENEWRWDDKQPIVREVTRIRAWASGRCGRHIDLQFEFSPVEDGVTLARRGTDKYGGLNIRLAQVADSKLTHHADTSRNDQQMAWQAITGKWSGADESAALAVVERAENPDYPADYIEYPNLPWFQPTFPKAGKRHALTQEKPLILRYRLWIRSGGIPSESDYRRLWTSFNSTTQSP
jgi:hypothetical protein